MKTSSSRTETQLSFALPVCTPLVENSDPAGVALGGNDGQGVCACLSAYPASSVECFRFNRDAVAYGLSMASSPFAARLYVLAKESFFASVELKRDCGYLLFLH